MYVDKRNYLIYIIVHENYNQEGYILTIICGGIMKTITKILFVLITLSLVYPLSGGIFTTDTDKEGKEKKCAVCKTAIAKDAPEIKTEYKGKTFYFNSEKCKEKFLKDPDKYALSYEKKIEYICENCHVHAEKPGKCPKCGKELEKHEAKIAYVCPMKQCNYKTNKPGNCPKCGMKLKKTTLHDHDHGHDHKHEHEQGEKHEHNHQQ
jgi:YHS domain-containing protein